MSENTHTFVRPVVHEFVLGSGGFRMVVEIYRFLSIDRLSLVMFFFFFFSLAAAPTDGCLGLPSLMSFGFSFRFGCRVERMLKGLSL